MENKSINWQQMLFKGKKVWMATSSNGKPVTKNGKILMKYQLNQDYEYWVLPKNLEPVSSEKISKKTYTQKKNKFETQNSSDEVLFKDAICLYTDGACSGNPGPAGIGVLIRFQGNEKEISEYIGIGTNNIAELEAIRTGLEQIDQKNLPVRVFTDSNYSYGLLVKDWKPKKNQELVKATKDLMLQFKDLKFIKVKGHAGHEGNERADFLATSAIKKVKYATNF